MRKYTRWLSLIIMLGNTWATESSDEETNIPLRRNTPLHRKGRIATMDSSVFSLEFGQKPLRDPKQLESLDDDIDPKHFATADPSSLIKAIKDGAKSKFGTSTFTNEENVTDDPPPRELEFNNFMLPHNIHGGAELNEILLSYESLYYESPYLNSAVALLIALTENCFDSSSYDEIKRLDFLQHGSYYLSLLTGISMAVLRLFVAKDEHNKILSLAYGVSTTLDIILTTYNSHVVHEKAKLQEIVYGLFVSKRTGIVNKKEVKEIDKKLILLVRQSTNYIESLEIEDPNIKASLKDIKSMLKHANKSDKTIRRVNFGVKGINLLATICSTVGMSLETKWAYILNSVASSVSAGTNVLTDRQDAEVAVSGKFFKERLWTGELFYKSLELTKAVMEFQDSKSETML